MEGVESIQTIGSPYSKRSRIGCNPVSAMSTITPSGSSGGSKRSGDSPPEILRQVPRKGNPQVFRVAPGKSPTLKVSGVRSGPLYTEAAGSDDRGWWPHRGKARSIRKASQFQRLAFSMHPSGVSESAAAGGPRDAGCRRPHCRKIRARCRRVHGWPWQSDPHRFPRRPGAHTKPPGR